MREYFYAIYDGTYHPAHENAWPGHDGVAIKAESLDAVARVLVSTMLAGAEAKWNDGVYAKGRSIPVEVHASVWDESGAVLLRLVADVPRDRFTIS